MLAASTDRVEAALAAAKETGGNACFRHDGETCVAVSSVFQPKTQNPTETLSLASLWKDSGSDTATNPMHDNDSNSNLSGRSLFAANLNRRLAEWKRGGSTDTVAVMRIDQLDDLVARFGDQGQWFLRQVMGRLLEAATRDMDERCEFEDGLFALLLPATDETNALAVADRLRAQVRQCKVRMGSDIWDLSASIGVAHCTVADRVMDIMRSAENAMLMAVKGGGDGVCVGQDLPTSPAVPAV
jgi:diguanylate cyclase (GGDEF)-like protein